LVFFFESLRLGAKFFYISVGKETYIKTLISGRVLKKPAVAFVIQRYGIEVAGGAEMLCRLTAERLSQHWNIEILTTCAKDYIKRFQNDYPAGVESINGVKVRRFNIDYFRSRDQIFAELDCKVIERNATTDEEKTWLKEIGPYSSELMDYVSGHKSDFEVFIFFTYLYATTTLILPLVKDKAILVPTAHDEAPIKARFYDQFFELPKALVFSTPEEMQFVVERSNNQIPTGIIAGVGISAPEDIDPALFRREIKLSDDFVLYVGRIQKEKGCYDLIDTYLSLAARIHQIYPLVLLGKSAMPIPRNRFIIAPGFVSEQLKFSALKAARLVVMPSEFESLNIVLLEAWHCRCPVLVNGHSEVMKAQCRRSNGGLWYNNAEEFEACLSFMLNNQDLSLKMADSGKHYVEQNYSWEIIVKKYLDLTREIFGLPSNAYSFNS